MNGDRLLDEADRVGGFAGLDRDDAEQVERIRIARLKVEELAIESLRGGEVAGLMAGDGFIQEFDRRWHWPRRW
jgi:hypothetical protein